VNVSFVLLLFEYRGVFHGIAARQTPPGTAVSSVICWVDVILSQLAAAVISGPPTTDQSEFPGLKKQREDDTLRAAAQLPCKFYEFTGIAPCHELLADEWRNVIGIISSDTIAPATCRLALRLVFVVYIVGSKICHENILTKTDRLFLSTFSVL
jgi:hypothetical protein